MSDLVIENLAKFYKKRAVVNDVSLTVKQGEIIGLLGPNGAGKTTCFYMILGLIVSDGGRIKLNGVDITGMPVHARAKLGLGYLPQEASVFRKLTVADNILAVLQVRKDLTTAMQQEQLNSLLDEFHLQNVRESLGISLSGGERRRLEIARALASEPKFILLDEPFAGVDPISIAEIKKIIKYLANRNIGVIITDHNVRETLDICDRAYILNNGAVIAGGSPAEILQDQQVRQVYLGEHFYI
ncbi:MAG TPA: LPS export ABC transporter ATP-binding protein [Gammaproteobacteria bacterium]|nr:LPS export ABC transporter ATP-binding protein [Gammaproteobacteria bacterium]